MQAPQSLLSLALNISHVFAQKSPPCLSLYARTYISPFTVPCEQQLAYRIFSPVVIISGKELFAFTISSSSSNNRRFPSFTMAAPAVESRILMTEDQLLQQQISDHLDKIATAMRRMADAMEESTIVDGITHPHIREPPPSYDSSINIVIDPGRPCLQTTICDRIDAIERDKRTLQMAFGIAMTGTAICYFYSEGPAIPLPALFGMLLALAVGCAISRRIRPSST